MKAKHAAVIRAGIKMAQSHLVWYSVHNEHRVRPPHMPRLWIRAYGHAWSTGFKKLCLHCRWELRKISILGVSRWEHKDSGKLGCGSVQGDGYFTAHPMMTLCHLSNCWGVR